MTDGTIDLSSDINCITPSVSLKCNLTNQEIHLERTVAQFYGLDESNCLFYKNEESLFHSLANHFSDKNVTFYSPNNTKFVDIMKQHNYEIDAINIFKNIDRAVEHNSIVYFTNPSYVDGKYYELEDFLEAWSKVGCKIVVDETFLEFSKYKSITQYLSKYENLYIIKNTSKILGLDQFTFSLLITSKNNIECLSSKMPSGIFSLLEKKYFVDACSDEVFQNTFRAINIKNNLLLESILNQSELFEKIYPSCTNRILVKVKSNYVNSLKNFLDENKILFHRCEIYEYLDENYMSFNVGDEKKLRLFEKVLHQFIKMM
jgi:histidinol-phosphate/aromatic aminotransferase/cobyric acid decarboxylase-like protein